MERFSINNIKEGDIIRAPFWIEPVKIYKIQILSNDMINIVGLTVNSKQSVDVWLSEEDFNKIDLVSYDIDFSFNSFRAFLVIEAMRFMYASIFDPLLAMNVSKVEPLPFQLEAVYGYVLNQNRIRFLIADDPGAGKTIMAGLVLKELKLRKLVNRILIVVPSHLKEQWRRELKEKFDEKFDIIDRTTFNSQYYLNPWEQYNQVITSMDFAKQDEILQSLSSVYWDLVIVDEAHKMAAYKYLNNRIIKTQRYKLGEVLSKNSMHLLFLTATPHKGDSENFRLFLDLLNPGFFANSKMIEESIQNKDNPLFIRRLKEDLKDFNGKPIFTRRFPITIKFRLSDAEKELYNELSHYLLDQYEKSFDEKFSVRDRSLEFALMILQRRMASSVYALLQSLQRRKQKLQQYLENHQKNKFKESEYKLNQFRINQDEFSLIELDDLEENERWEKEKELESFTASKSYSELKNEIDILEKLINKAQVIIDNEEEVKLRELKEAINKAFQKIKEIQGNPKILVFTESKDTLDYLVNKIRSWGYKVNYIHGGMSMDERIQAEKIFKNYTDIMVATEAAGEGINLQFCHIMINYDIPWNPNRLEQRMGRIHRYGQQKDVYIFNLIAEDTREGKVLLKIFEKLEEIRSKLGSDRVFDVIGEIFESKNLYQLILDVVTNPKNIYQILEELDMESNEEYISKIRDILGESLATKFIDYTNIKNITEKVREYKLAPEYLEEFFIKSFIYIGGKLSKNKDNFISIDYVPLTLREKNKDKDFVNKYGSILVSYRKVTFDKEVAFRNHDVEFISFGHPLFEALLSWIIDNFKDQAKKGAIFKDVSGYFDGYIWFYVIEIKDGNMEVAARKIIAIYDDGQNIRPVNPAILWDLVPINTASDNFNNYLINPIDISYHNKRLLPFVMGLIKEYKDEILKDRERQANIKRKYGIKSLEYLIDRLNEEIADLYDRLSNGEKVDLPIKNKEETMKRYEKNLDELKKSIERELSLTISNPELISVIRVIPVRDEMVEDYEIERMGMELAMEYERQAGRLPQDVSKDNLGFDIKSKGKDEVRYIEVKTRATFGQVALTPNEWIKAKRFKEQYYLYVVLNVLNDPVLYIIKNPAENLKVSEKIEIVRFIVPFEELQTKKQEIWKNPRK